MKAFPKDIKFKYNWRKYQQRVLDELHEYLSDNHLHVVAPPGSGKTVLGLEVMLRLNRPTLILSPSITIRNQWIQRFCELFLQTGQPPEWISTDIRNPRFMTVITYQGLHAACNNLGEESDETDEDKLSEEDESNHKEAHSPNANLDAIAKGLQEQGIQTIVVDEAHHLKNEWCHTLTLIKQKIQPIVVGLTATPPYDVTATEWQRYIELNGPVDTEISVPELVAEGDLCPHQDYLYFTQPTEEERKAITDFRKNIDKLFQEIKQDPLMAEAIAAHPIWLNPMEQLDWIYSNLACYSACLIYLNAAGKEIPKIHLEVVGDKQFNIPPLDYKWMETLLDFYLSKENIHFAAYEEHRESLEKRLMRYGAMEKRQISFSYNRRTTGSLSSSISKLEGIRRIVDFEYGQMGNSLRMVILSDFIRKEYLVGGDENDMPLNKIGVIPIFEKLRRECTDERKIGVLTGSLVIIPLSAYAAFEARAAEYGIAQINASTVSYDNRYMVIYQSEQVKYAIVQIVTHIFQAGEIEILIGTKSLLGEGWDAPAINSLVLASFVGSFVLSNQMRGRAIRSERGNGRKTGNIWHLACADPTSPTGGDDVELLKRRFRSFVGVSLDEQPTIENGVRRLHLSEAVANLQEIEQRNAKTFACAAERDKLQQQWSDAYANGVKLVEEIKIPFREIKEKRDYQTAKSLYLRQTIANLLAGLGFTFLSFSLDTILSLGRSLQRLRSREEVYYFLLSALILGGLSYGRQTYKTLRLYLKYRDISKDIEQIGDALLNSLVKTGVIQTDVSRLKVVTSSDAFGSVFCHLSGATSFERTTFINALYEVVSPIDNPRYVIVRKSRLMRLFKQQDYHAVPEILGRNKNQAEYFTGQWNRLVGACELIFTRTIDGRKMLLKSRVESLSAQWAEEPIERVNKWE